MIKIRRSNERGHAQQGWLDSFHTFSFADYHDPQQMGFRSLRVINEDRVAGGTGFDMHPHRDMEIITYVLSGVLQHRDSMGNSAVIKPGEVQRMTAGTGVLHSEHNASPSEPVHLLQIWIVPESKGLKPGYEQKSFSSLFQTGGLHLVASRTGKDGSVHINQDVNLYAGKLPAGHKQTIQLQPQRHAWVQVASGAIEIENQELHAGDAAAVSGQPWVAVSAKTAAEVLVFDLT